MRVRGVTLPKSFDNDDGADDIKFVFRLVGEWKRAQIDFVWRAAKRLTIDLNTTNFRKPK